MMALPYVAKSPIYEDTWRRIMCLILTIIKRDGRNLAHSFIPIIQQIKNPQHMLNV